MDRDRTTEKTDGICRALCLAAVVPWVVAALACAQTDAPTGLPPSEPVTLTIGYPHQTGQDPLYGVQQLARLLSFEGLSYVTREGRPQPRLAESWTESVDGLTWTIQLRRNAFFHDGTPVDSSAVKQSLDKSLRSPDLYRSPGLLDIVEVETPSPDTLLIRLRDRSSFLLEDLSIPITKNGPTGPVGTGPFVTTSAAGDELAMAAMSNYYRGKPTISRVVWKSYPAVRSAWAAMMRGDVDFLYEVAPEAVEFIEPETSVQVFPFLRNYVHLVVYNSRRPPFNDPRVRRALNYAIDRERLIQQALRGHGRTVSGPAWPQHWAYDSSVPNYSYEPSKATALMDSAKIPALGESKETSGAPGRFHFTCLLPENWALWERMALIVQRDLAEIGVDMQIESVPFMVFNQRIGEGNFDAVIMETIVGNTASRPFTFWYSKSTVNAWGFHNPLLDRALDNLRRASNESDYRNAFRQVQIESLDDPPGIFLALGEVSRAVSKRFKVIAPPGSDILPSIFDWQTADVLPGMTN